MVSNHISNQLRYGIYSSKASQKTRASSANNKWEIFTPSPPLPLTWQPFKKPPLTTLLIKQLSTSIGLDSFGCFLRVGSFVYFLYALRLLAVLYISFAYQKKKIATTNK